MNHTIKISIKVILISLLVILGSGCGQNKMENKMENKASINTQVNTVELRILNIKNQLKENPNDYNNWRMLGDIYFDSNQHEEAIKAYNQSLFLHENDANVWTDLGVMYRRTKQPLEAIKAFDKANEIEPTHQQSLFNKGVVLLYDLNDKKGALNAWEQLIKINPNATAPNGMKISELIQTINSENNQ